VINFDETSLSSIPSTKQLHVAVVEEQIHSIPAPISLSKTSCLFCIASDGSFYPTTILVSQKNVPSEFIQTENLRFICANNGWMHRETLEKIFEEILIPALNRRRELSGDRHSPALIVVDGHNSRHSAKIYSMCIKENIDILSIPAHTSHLLQPLDNGVNYAFKKSVSTHRLYEMVQSEKENRAAFFIILQDAVNTALTYKTIKHSWKEVGLHPFNPYLVLKTVSIIPPPYLKIYQKKTIHTTNINGKFLVLSFLNYSFENLHIENDRELKENTIFNIHFFQHQKKFLESANLQNSSAELINKISELNTKIEKENLILQKLNKNYNHQNIIMMNDSENPLFEENEDEVKTNQEEIQQEKVKVLEEVQLLSGKIENHIENASTILENLEEFANELKKKIQILKV
jgi:hypothetical protein